MTSETSTLNRVSALETRQAAQTGGLSLRQGIRLSTWPGARPVEDAKQKHLGASGMGGKNSDWAGS